MSGRLWPVAWGVAVLAAVGGASVGAAPAKADATAQKAWRLLFVRFRPLTGGWRLRDANDIQDIWVANGDGTDARLLIQDGERPTWSPDRKRIAFFRRSNLCVADADGGGQQQLTTWAPEEDWYTWQTPGISWGPLPGRLAFSRPQDYEVCSPAEPDSCSVPGSALFELFLGSPTHELRCLFGWYDCSAYTAPAWSPSGEYLAFAREGDIWVARRNQDPALQDRTPYPWSWTRLAAVAHHDAATDHSSMWGYGVTRLSWSPDGKLLAYGMIRFGGSGINIVRIMRLARTDMEGSFINLSVAQDWLVTEQGRDPCFSPDGTRLVYGTRSGVWIATLDGKWKHLLLGNGEQPCW